MMPPSLSYPHETPPAAGTAMAVAPGMFWLRMPLPFALDHINLWLLADGDGWTTVDCGIALEPVRAAWQQALAGRRLDRCIVTHFHPDHLGLAHWLEQQTGAGLWMTQTEYLTAQAVYHQLQGFCVPSMLEFFRAHGLDTARLEALAGRGNAYRKGVPEIPGCFRRLQAEENIAIGDQDWRVLIGNGHAPEHASLYCASQGVLISGDMLLPRISTNVSV